MVDRNVRSTLDRLKGAILLKAETQPPDSARLTAPGSRALRRSVTVTCSSFLVVMTALAVRAATVSDCRNRGDCENCGQYKGDDFHSPLPVMVSFDGCAEFSTINSPLRDEGSPLVRPGERAPPNRLSAMRLFEALMFMFVYVAFTAAWFGFADGKSRTDHDLSW